MLEGSGEGFAERDLLRADLFEDGAGSFEGSAVPAGEVASTRGRFGLEAGRFTVLLVGKDGTLKYRFDEPVWPAELYDLIDAMPMRRREMREGR